MPGLGVPSEGGARPSEAWEPGEVLSDAPFQCGVEGCHAWTGLAFPAAGVEGGFPAARTPASGLAPGVRRGVRFAHPA